MSGDLQKALGRNLKKRREALGLSQEKFAEYLGFHRTYAGALERGERNISLKSLETLAELLEVTPLELLRE
ncbi:MAG: transcriptional regulator [Aeromicrobium sp.]|jgi:transcriptional regulator with XRE-family HTH domain|nr:transcriptional regulator [Aeromicrobium sp.]